MIETWLEDLNFGNYHIFYTFGSKPCIFFRLLCLRSTMGSYFLVHCLCSATPEFALTFHIIRLTVLCGRFSKRHIISCVCGTG
jgi:hypothetical protein